MNVGCVVLTTGRRPRELELALDSLLAQRGVELDIVVVGNGWEPQDLPGSVRGVGLAVDRGTTTGRNAGAPHTQGELLFFLDDDASVAEPDALARVVARFESDPRLGLLQLRVDPLGHGSPPRDWVPRLRVGDRQRSGEVAAVWEGAVAIRRKLFDAVGGWPGPFRIVHEGIDLAWRVMDDGYRVEYAGDIAVRHPVPAPVPARHSYSLYLGVRNRVWLARRHLPAPLGLVNVVAFGLRALLRVRSAGDLRAVAKALRDGVREPCGPRKPLHASTLWRMTRIGRPPVL
jgi:GT2 family glycosyltransferase